MTIDALRELISTGMRGLLMVLVGYGSNNNRLRVLERMKWIVCHSDRKYPRQLLLAVYQISESVR